MTPKTNYQSMLDSVLQEITRSGKTPSLLLHACCAPCSSYVLEYLNEYFDITLFFYNPNISPIEEYHFRAKELQRLVSEMPLQRKVKIIVPEYDSTPFEKIAAGKEHLPERGARCADCYGIRLQKTFEEAASLGVDYFSTTLSISPHKDAEVLNRIGCALAEGGKVKWLYSDFKKKNGYKRSIELSAEYGLYRQNYCGCVYSQKNSLN